MKYLWIADKNGVLRKRRKPEPQKKFKQIPEFHLVEHYNPDEGVIYLRK